MRRICLLLMTVLAAGLMSSCALLPEEEAIRTAPVVRTYTRPEYQTVPVERGDLIQTGRISCSYVPVRTASLSFALDDEYIDRYMVQTGDSVMEGQLLAQLQLGDLETRMGDVNNAIAELQLRMDHQEKRYDLELRRLAVTTARMDAAEKKEALVQAEENFDRIMKEMQDDMELHRLELAACKNDLSERQIRAPFAGTVTRVARFEKGDKSEYGTSVITLVDSARSVFRASTEHWDRFAEGDSYEIVVGKTPYKAVVTSEEALGLEMTQKTPGKKASVYFALLQPSFELEEGDTGVTDIVLEERFGVLHVPSKAVSAAGGQAIVYYLREDGMRAYKPVEIGVTIENRTEILSGLSEGESIIVE